MTLTTIKVDSATRDRLKRLAAARHVTLGQYLDLLADRAERAALFEQMRLDFASTPDRDWASYHAETELWQSLDADLDG